jgi:hypothetical protein
MLIARKPSVLMFGWEFPPFNSGGLGVACEGLSKALSAKYEKPSARTEVLKGIIGHILTSK